MLSAPQIVISALSSFCDSGLQNLNEKVNLFLHVFIFMIILYLPFCFLLNLYFEYY